VVTARKGTHDAIVRAFAATACRRRQLVHDNPSLRAVLWLSVLHNDYVLRLLLGVATPATAVLLLKCLVAGPRYKRRWRRCTSALSLAFMAVLMVTSCQAAPELPGGFTAPVPALHLAAAAAATLAAGINVIAGATAAPDVGASTAAADISADVRPVDEWKPQRATLKRHAEEGIERVWSEECQDYGFFCSTCNTSLKHWSIRQHLKKAVHQPPAAAQQPVADALPGVLHSHCTVAVHKVCVAA
jgi:hypothetical protein